MKQFMPLKLKSSQWQGVVLENVLFNLPGNRFICSLFLSLLHLWTKLLFVQMRPKLGFCTSLMVYQVNDLYIYYSNYIKLMYIISYIADIPDQGFEESDTSSALSGSPRLQPHSAQTNSSIDTQHASLKRKKGEKPEPVASPVLEKSQSLQTELAQQRPLSMVVASQSEANVSLSPSTGSLHRQVSGFFPLSSFLFFLFFFIE